MTREAGSGKRGAVALVGLLANLAACAPWAVPSSRVPLPASLCDVVIRNGRVLDGAGNPWILADVAIKDGRFAKIGVVTDRGAREIDARGRYVSPGWVDMMDQSGG